MKMGPIEETINFRNVRQEKLAKLLKEEKAMARPKAGELWRHKYNGGYSTIFWIEGRLPRSSGKVEVNDREIIMTLGTEYNDSRYIEGVDIRWTMRAIIGGKVAYGKYVSLNGWHRFFERVL